MEAIMLKRLGIITEQITQATNQAIAHCQSLDNVEEAEITCRKLETAINRFTSELHNYFKLSTEPSADDISMFSETQLKGEEVLTELNVRLDKRKEQRLEDHTSRASGSNLRLQSSKLPKLDLPKYDGDILQWHQFWDQFQSNIGCRNLSDVDKLLYLKASLTDNAEMCIDGLEVTNKNYSIAINTLKERFGKESQIIDAHYSALYKIRMADKTPEDARRTLNEVERHLRVLNSLGEDVKHNHLRFLITEKFPEDIVYEMKMMVKSESIEEMRKVLEIIISAREDASRAQDNNKVETYTTENLHIKDISQPRKFKGFQENFNKTTQYNKHPEERNKNQMKRSYERAENENGPERKKLRRNCIFCDGAHYNDMCQMVKTLSEKKAKLKGRCYGCLSTNHAVRECKAKVYCIHCQQEGSHNRALCPKTYPTKRESTKSFHVKSKTSTVLQTAVVRTKNAGNSGDIDCRVLLDSGSQRTYVTQNLAKRLNLPEEENCRLSVFTFASSKPQEFDSAIVKLQLQTRTKEILTIFANVVPTISEGVAYPEEALNKWKNRAILADDGSLSSRIDILIGNDYYFTLISTGKVKLNDNLFLVESKLGWILSGILPNPKPADTLSAITYFQYAEHRLIQPDLPLNNGNIKCLWELECIGIYDSPKANRDEEVVKHFNETTKVIDDRYTVSWPWNEYPPNLTANFGLAFGRLVNMLKRLDTENLKSYNEAIQEQLEKEIIEVVPEEQTRQDVRSHPVHYLPHHGVCQPGKQVRIVYDASAKVKDSKSLNECLHSGPIMLENLTGMFLRFRSHQIGIVADVEKAFLQLALHDEDKDVTRFLWLKDITKPASESNLVHLRFRRVPFGIISSPFLLNATIKHHLSHHHDKSIKQMANDIYVDNLVTGTRSSKEAIALYKTSKEAFQDISMNMRAWSSNSKELMNQIPKDDTCNDSDVKVLGLKWHVQDDTIQLRCKTMTNANTKREVLKYIASIYDPCGYAVAYLLPAKLFLQELWKRKQLKWDTHLPSDLASKWSQIAKDLEDIETIILPRCYFKDINHNDIQVHCFVDASMQAYSAAVYITNKKEVAFVIGKSRLVPIKDQEELKIPRLELLGTLIGSRLIKYVTESIHIKFVQQILWTDSQIVIDWFNSSKLLTPFVARRIKEIKENTNLIIRKVPTQLNSADVATRPNQTREDKQRWLSGPNFLSNDPKSWPSSHNKVESFLCGEGLTNQEIPESENNQDTHKQQCLGDQLDSYPDKTP